MLGDMLGVFLLRQTTTSAAEIARTQQVRCRTPADLRLDQFDLRILASAHVGRHCDAARLWPCH